MKLPCKEIKCLKYPVCKQSKFITCTPLREYCDEVTQISKFQDGEDVWDILYSTFPNLLGVQLDQAPKDSNITNVKDLLLNRHKVPMQMLSIMTYRLNEPKDSI